MGFPVTYTCPRCGALHKLERDGYLADRAVTPYPLEGWRYAAPDEDFERDDVDGVRIVCGTESLLVADDELEEVIDVATDEATNDTTDEATDDTTDEATNAEILEITDDGCDEPFYLSFVRYEDGVAVDPLPESTVVELNVGPRRPQGPEAPTGPRGPDGSPDR